MNTLTLLFSVLLYLSLANARNLNEEQTGEDYNEPNRRKDHNRAHLRRRRWQMNYGYDYPPPPPYYPNRRDFDRDDTVQQIHRLLDELTAYVRRPQPPPQPIYIPYPVPYYVPQLSCNPEGNFKPNLTTRFPDIEPERNWGFVVDQKFEQDEEDSSEFVRPISFDPIKPKQVMRKPAPKTEHGSKQASAQFTTAAPSFPEQLPVPDMCVAAILTCCGSNDLQKRKECFTSVGCAMTYSKSDVCSVDSVNSVLEVFKTAYAPV